jgi:CIC family chloride channel protein
MKIKLPYRVGLTRLSILGILVGIIAGLGALFFRDLIGLIHNIAFLGKFRIDYNASEFTPPGPWGAWIIAVPVFGSLLVTFLVETFAPEARGHGVPEVIDSIYYREGVIRPAVGVIKSLASAISIGTGAAVGREGPIAQIGASFGSLLGQIIKMAPWQRITLVAAGAGAGIAATFNTPIGGVMFAIELMMPEFSARTFLPVALATGTATFIGRIFFGINPSFGVPSPVMVGGRATFAELLLYAFLGVLMGIVAALFIRGLHSAEQIYERIGNPYARHATGMLLLGLLIFALLREFGHYYIEGVSYATIQAILNGGLTSPGLLVLLFAAKLFGTWTSLGSGGSGGIFSPSLFIGAVIGAAFGTLVPLVLPAAAIGTVNCAIIGMAAMVGGATGAPVTAVIMIFEMTRDYDVVMPSIIAVALSIGVRRLLSRESIYTIKLISRRHYVPEALQANILLVRRASQMMEHELVLLPADSDIGELVQQTEYNQGPKHVIVTRGDHIIGFVSVTSSFCSALEHRAGACTVGDLAEHNFIVAWEGDVMFNVLARMARRGASAVLVAKGRGSLDVSQLSGIITKERIADSLGETVVPYSE